MKDPAAPSDPTVVSLVHLGCARNLIDSELILARMAEEGLLVSGDPADADAVVVNTCSFIGPARTESEETIRRYEEEKRRGALRHLVVAGCLVQRYKHRLERRFPLVDVFAEISDYRELARTLRDLTRGRRVRSYLASPGLREPERDAARMLATPGSYAYLRISHGCDHTCGFCAIPAIRGPHRSKRPEAVLEEARELIGAGVKELVLVAEDSTAWGRDLGSELPDLVEALAELEGDHQVRVMYAYPNNFPWRLAELLRDHPRVARYLDIPVQHAATPVLRAMRRAGSGDQVRRTLDRLRTEVPDLEIRTTLLVGYPGETAADAAELAPFVREYGLGRLGAFTFSREEDTPAWDLPDPVPEDVAVERYLEVVAARDEVLAAGQRALVGSEVEVLVDERAQHGGEPVAVGRTERDAPEVDPLAVLPGVDAPVGARVRARVVDVDDEMHLVCEPVAEPAAAPAAGEGAR